MAQEVFKSNSSLAEALNELKALKEILIPENSVLSISRVENHDLLPKPLRELTDLPIFEDKLMDDNNYYQLVIFLCLCACQFYFNILQMLTFILIGEYDSTVSRTKYQ